MGHSKELGFNSEYKRKSECVEQRTAGGLPFTRIAAAIRQECV